MLHASVNNKRSLADRRDVHRFTLKIMVLQTSKQVWANKQNFNPSRRSCIQTEQMDGISNAPPFTVTSNISVNGKIVLKKWYIDNNYLTIVSKDYNVEQSNWQRSILLNCHSHHGEPETFPRQLAVPGGRPGHRHLSLHPHRPAG